MIAAIVQDTLTADAVKRTITTGSPYKAAAAGIFEQTSSRSKEGKERRGSRLSANEIPTHHQVREHREVEPC